MHMNIDNNHVQYNHETEQLQAAFLTDAYYTLNKNLENMDPYLTFCQRYRGSQAILFIGCTMMAKTVEE